MFNTIFKMSLKAKKSFKTAAPFGFTSKRFLNRGLHPKFDSCGGSENLSPGSYNPDKMECSYKKYTLGWKRKSEVEEFSQQLGYRNSQLLKEREFRKTLLGPGCYNISDELYKKQTHSCMQNVGFGKHKRFWNPYESTNPGTGTYFRNANELSTIARKQFSDLPTFEWDGFIDRFKDTSPPYTKPPNLYNPVDVGSIDALLNKQVSKRGPYDLFTGPRDGSTIKNSFAPPAFKPPDLFYTFPSTIDTLLNHPLKERDSLLFDLKVVRFRSGKFLQEVRFGKPTLRHMIDDATCCIKDPEEPSPCSYNIRIEKEMKKNMYPFNTSSKYARPLTKWAIHPSVGRYHPKYQHCMKPKKESWIFRSKSGRTEYKAVEYNSF